jgi:hypothetical protein
MKLLVTLHGRLDVLGTPENIKTAIVAWNGLTDEAAVLVDVEEVEPDSVIVTESYLDSIMVPY